MLDVNLHIAIAIVINNGYSSISMTYIFHHFLLSFCHFRKKLNYRQCDKMDSLDT